MAISLLTGMLMLDVCTGALFARRRVAVLCWALLILTLILTPALGHAQTVTATWDPSLPTDHVTGYQVCVGTASRSCNQQFASLAPTAIAFTFTPTPGVLEYVSVRAKNASGVGSYSTEVSFSIPGFSAPLNRSTPVNRAISPQQISVSDPDGSSLQFTHTGLPVGLTLSPSGLITGSPTAAGRYNVTIFVTDGLVTVSQTFVWTVTTGASADITAPQLSITSHSSGQTVSSPTVTLSGTASDNGAGGSGIASVNVNGLASAGGTATGNGTANWSRTITLSNGTNTISVEAQDGAGNIQMRQLTLRLASQSSSNSTSTATSTSAVRITGLSSNLSSPQGAGAAITFTAGAAGGTGSYQFKWWVYDGATWTMVQNWSATRTYTWRPTVPGTGYRVGIWARDATSNVDSSAINLSVPFGVVGTAPAVSAPAPSSPSPSSITSSSGSASSSSSAVQITGLTTNLASPQGTGTSITFTAGATGGTGSYQFKWWVYDGTTWTMVRNWSTTTTYTWRPTEAGTGYRVGIWARDSSTTADTSAVNLSMPFSIVGTSSTTTSSTRTSTSTSSSSTSTSSSTSASTLRITGLTSNVSSPRVGNSVRLNATAAGGTGSYQFKWWVFDGATWTMARDWSSTPTFTWQPRVANANSRVGIWLRDSSTYADVGTINLSIPTPVGP